MTSTVKASAHCGPGKEMVLQVVDSNDVVVREEILQDGESREVVVYDELRAQSYERLKA